MEELLAQLLQQRALQTKAQSDAKHGAVIAQLRASTEAQGYAKLDQMRAMQRDLDERRTRLSEDIGRVTGKAPYGRDVIGPGGSNPIARRERIDAVGADSPYTKDIAPSMTDQDLAVGGAARRAKLGNAVPQGQLDTRGHYGVRDDEAGNSNVEMFSPDVVPGTEMNGLISGWANPAYDGPTRPGTPIDPDYTPLSLKDQLRNRSDQEAADIIVQRMQRLQHVLAGYGDTPYL